MMAKAVPEGFLDIDSLKALDLPNIQIAGSYASGRATTGSDMDILIGLTDAEWAEVTPRQPPEVLTKIFAILPEDRLDVKLYQLSNPKELWYFVQGKKGVSGVFLPTKDKPLLAERLWKGAVELREAPSLREQQFLPTPPTASVVEYDRRYTLEELREKARQAGLSPSGSKKGIAAKLIAKGVK